MREKENIDIVELIESEGVSLRRQGRELVGLCPFHADNHPSLYVAPAKNVFLCRSCGEGGDAIRFIERLHSVSFKDALKILHIDPCKRPRRPRPSRQAERVASWASREHLKIGAILRALSREIATAEEANATALTERFGYEFAILEDVFEALMRPEAALALHTNAKDFVEMITANAPDEPLPEFPPMTPWYREYLRRLVAGVDWDSQHQASLDMLHEGL